MNKFYLSLLAAFIIPTITGCSTVKGIFGKSASKETVARAEITVVDKEVAKVNVQKLDRIGEYSYGIKLVTNTPPAVIDLNERIGSLANQPTLEAMKEMEKLVSQLMTNNHKLLLKKDKEIEDLQEDTIKLNLEKETAINKYIELASATAMKTDTLQSSLNQMNSWGGLGAIWYGLKRLIVRMAWGIGIFSIIFVILRVASMSNPMAASVFSIFSKIGSWFIGMIEFIVPKAAEMAGHTATAVFNAYKSTLTKVVDAIQMAKERAAAAGKEPNINDVLDEVSKSMNTDEKAIVDELKKALNWKQ
jgi:hypothetical protein